MTEEQASHEEQACGLLGMVHEYDTTDEWSRARQAQVTLEAAAHAQLAAAQAAGRLADAMERLARAWEQGGTR